ncbi:hypothetical protein [Methylobacterium radiotolerans]|uniref:hypothetical protein n=1 Tax=Methylobacterium radiotolerans TaxID=31998 RepID=UPI001F30D0E6|nr:hypothetical protein [Methylobacterium radiotolerans]UIY45664.1 hypothetical protein LZ599_31400 [Methylobacterium radiotolerans]
MLLFAILSAALAVLGSLVGFGVIGHPIGSQAVDSYGWGLAINAIAIGGFLLFVRYQRAKRG